MLLSKWHTGSNLWWNWNVIRTSLQCHLSITHLFWRQVTKYYMACRYQKGVVIRDILINF